MAPLVPPLDPLRLLQVQIQDFAKGRGGGGAASEADSCRRCKVVGRATLGLFVCPTYLLCVFVYESVW